VKHHHERWDGSGYPDGLRGESIPRTARILSVADVYDALTSSRSYRAAWSHERAMREIRRNAGTQFDPEVVKAFEQVVEDVRARMEPSLFGQAYDPARAAGTRGPVTTPRSAEAVRQIQRSSSELWALYEVSQTLSASLGPDDLLEILGRKLLAIFPDTGCAFLLFERKPEESEALYCRHAVGWNQEHFADCQSAAPDGTSLRVATEQRSYLGPFDPFDLVSVDTDSAEPRPIGTALIVPIVHQGAALGTINLYHAEENAFEEHVRNLLETIAQRAAMALYNGLTFERTRSHAITDPLTGLANIRRMTDWIEERLHSDRKADRFALLCLDLDSFKPINDNFGHQKGDVVLRDLAEIFRNLVREGDLVGRNGGDEFVVLLREAGPNEAEVMKNRLQTAVTGYDPGLVHPRLGELRLGVSIGSACYPSDGTDIATLFSIADAAMYRNKTDRKLEQMVGSRRTDEVITSAEAGEEPDRETVTDKMPAYLH
ncbi:MAG: diguanylate cyclase, partial [Capsulimonadales bacterium]|nr:diguanylate cyclase [Capsulimonadales bacterium]